MEITLQERTADYVRIYFERTQDDQIDRMLPRSVNSLDQALENFAQTKLPDAKSYGKTIYADDRYTLFPVLALSPLPTTLLPSACWRKTVFL